MRGTLKALTCLFLLYGAVIAGSPTEAAAAALANVVKVPKEIRHEVRYLSLYNLTEEHKETLLKALPFHVHSLSRESDIPDPSLRTVPGGLVRVWFGDYGWTREVWEKLAPNEPYFHTLDTRVIRTVKIEVPAVVAPAVVVPVQPDLTEKVYVERGGFLNQVARADVRPGERVFVRTKPGHLEEEPRGKVVVKQPQPAAPAKQEDTEKREFADQKAPVPTHAPWIDPKVITELALETNSDVPIVRADWFLYWTSTQKDRGGAGYYDWLGLKHRRDAEKLAGLDVEAARKKRKEIAAIVDDSGVALNNRQILWYAVIDGDWFETLDALKNTARRNALRLYDGDFQFDAQEVYFSLPNDLFGLLALNADGTLQDVVPNDIAGDNESTSNDKRIHAGLISCVRCHVEGIRPIDDWARATYDGPEALGSRDPKKLKRLQQLYLSDFQIRVKRAQQRYADALKKVNGLTSRENASTYAKAYTDYLEKRLSFDDICRELGGVKPEVLRTALDIYIKQGDADPVAINKAKRARRPLRREHFEEIYSLLQTIVRGVKP